MILDTSYVIALAEGDPGAVALSSEYEVAGIPQRLPPTVLSELYVAVGAGDDRGDGTDLQRAHHHRRRRLLER